MKELLPKISEAMNNTFVGNYMFSDEELNRIYDFTSKLLRNYDNGRGTSIPQEYDKLIFIAMVNAVKTWKSDEDTFWECIYKKLVGTNGSQKIYVHLTGVIDRLGKQGNIIYLSGCTKRYYATILAHTFAPLNSTESFLELCWNLYSEDMNFTYSKNDEIFVLVAEELKRTFSNEKSLEDDFKLGSGVYSLRAGIKRMAVDSSKEMVKYIEGTIALLDKVFNGEILDNDLYYNTIVYDWWREKERSFGLAKPKRKAYERTITDYSTIRPKYSYTGQQAVLVIPSIRLKNNFYDIPLLNIYHNGELVAQQDMYTFGSGLTMATKQLTLCVDTLVFEDGVMDCTLEIVHSGEVIYNSKTSLFRDHLLFRDDREILQEECLPGNYILFAPKLEEFSAYPENIKKVPGEPNLYIVQSKEGELLQNPKRTIFFVLEKQKRNIRIYADQKNNVKFIHDSEEFIVIDGELQVVVKSDIDISKYGVRYESTDFKLGDFTCTENDGYRTFLITELLNVCEPQKISIFSYVDNKIEASYNVVKFNSISITYDKKLYFDKENHGTVRFQTEKHDKSVSFDIAQGDIIIPFDDGDVVLSPPVLRWKIGNDDFSFEYGENLWYKDYSNSAELVIELPTEMGYQVFLTNNSILSESTSFNSFKLGEIVWSVLQDNKSEICVLVKIENIEVIPILTVCLKEKFKFSPFAIKGKELLWDASKAFIGDSTPRFRISFHANDVVKHSFDINENIDENYKSSCFSLSELEIGIYDVTVDLVTRKGFMTEKVVCLFDQQVVVGDINKIRFKGKCLRFEKVMLTGKASYEEIKPFYVDHLWYIGEFDGCHYYTGSVYIINRDGWKTYLNTMLNSQGTFDSVNPIRIELRNESSCFIVAGANPDDIYDFLGEFTLDTKNRISNFDRNTRGIDYFLFTTEEVK
ncbi:hypothetical protein [Cuneatibacter caecimuris]|uniref:Uncharacterized protein n=1 Tax=Cuneatibacter caecimuris TaxID=1796618 RepID=A0A4Q7PLS9_9FIRM|nr:hypothetical protein [Cuneatibacter caecimuris]RZT01078.1 hypothetical protein EV209_1518 [Cuneatibacter caecimuris]